MEGDSIFSFGRIYRKFVRKRANPGLILSLAIHGLVMLIPVSVVLVERYEELNLFIMNEEKPVIQPHRMVVKRIEKRVDSKVFEFPKIVEPPKEEVKETPEDKREIKKEELPKIDEKPIMEKNDIKERESVVIREEVPPIPLSLPVAVLPKEVSPSERPSAPPPTPVSTNQKTPEPVSTTKETVHLGPSQPLEVEFGNREGPKFLRRILPIYPVLARRMGKEGRVLLRLTIDEKGNLTEVEVIDHGAYGFTEAAVEAVRKSSFLPAYKDGKPVASRALLPIRFNLRSD